MIQDIANCERAPLSFRLSILSGEGVGLAAGKSRLERTLERPGRLGGFDHDKIIVLPFLARC